MQRLLMPDLLRLLALFGIAVVNVQYIAFSALQDFARPVVHSGLDSITLWLVNGLALLKTYGLFAFLFGVGFGLLMRSAASRGPPLPRLYRNRMLGLLILGSIHGCLFFPGDILSTYAIMGSVLTLFRAWSPRRLVGLGGLLLLLQVPIAVPLLLAMPETPQELLLLEQQLLQEGDFPSVVAFRSISYALLLPGLLIVQGTAALGWFCLGLAAVKAGLMDDPDHRLWRQARRWCLIPGVFGSLTAAAIWQWGAILPGALITIAIAPLTTLGYLGGIAWLARTSGVVPAWAIRAGGCSLSIYIGQSIVLSTVFSGYGPGLWEQVGRLTAVAIAFAVTTALVLALVLWRIRFPMGPAEWLLRRISRGFDHGRRSPPGL